MNLTADEAWARLLSVVKRQLPEQTFATWLAPTQPLELSGGTIYVGTPDRFAAEWNESKHAALIQSLAPVALGSPLQVVFRVNEEQARRTQMDLFVAPPPNADAKTTASAKGVVSAPLNDRYTFDHFVIGKSNELAAAASLGAAKAPGKVYNPLFIYGGTGLGKTHLMQAIAHEIVRHTSGMRIIYVGTEQFTNDFVGSLGANRMHDFRRRYRETDLLLVDDVHFLKGKEQTQEEFFHTFNALYEAGRQIVLTSDRPPSEIANLEARLVSRFQWGMVADIGIPDLEHRIAILQRKAQLDHLELTIPNDVIQFIAEHVRSSVRELEGCIIKLLAYASLKHREISLEVAREALRDKIRTSPSAPAPHQALHVALTMSLIQQVVASDWAVTPEGLQSKVRTKTLTVPRQVAMYLARELLAMQLVEIGQAFGGRDHSTVIHSLDRVTTAMRDDVTFRARVNKLRTTLLTYPR
ncbi:MAG: chromosomal replication initiator protein DnaA [Gemmatimonadaceae bacterium]